jgi:hypothetical protein
MKIPTIHTVTAQPNYHLLVTFSNRVQKLYDCRPLLTRPPFALLQTPAFFAGVRVDPGGYGVSWDDVRDLSEYELWTNGVVVSEGSLVVSISP